MNTHKLLISFFAVSSAVIACGPEENIELEDAESEVHGVCANADPSTGNVKTEKIIDRNISTTYSNGGGWQSATIDLGCTARITGVRRHMTRTAPNGTRVNHGESVSISKDGVTWGALTGATTFGWTSYVNYVSDAWHSLPYGWSKWLRPNKSVSARYVRYSWDGHADAMSEVEVSIRAITASATPINNTSAWDALDGSTSTGLQTNSTNWQNVTVDLGRPVLFSRLRRHMNGTGTTRGAQGERVQVSLDGTNYRDLLATDVTGWEGYNNYAPEAWDTVTYGWSEWMRVRNPKSVRYVRFLWDGNNDSLNELETDFITDAGDASYDFDPSDAAFASAVQNTHPFIQSGPIQIPLTLDQVRGQVGLTGAYDGHIFKRNNITGPGKLRAFMSLVDNAGDVRGSIIVLQSGLGYDGGLLCGNTDIPMGTELQVRLSPWTYDGRFAMQLGGSYDPMRDLRIGRQGLTTREVSGFPISGEVEVTMHAVLQTYLDRSHVVGFVEMVMPSPCNDATFEVQFYRREASLLDAYGY